MYILAAISFVRSIKSRNDQKICGKEETRVSRDSGKEKESTFENIDNKKEQKLSDDRHAHVRGLS